MKTRKARAHWHNGFHLFMSVKCDTPHFRHNVGDTRVIKKKKEK